MWLHLYLFVKPTGVHTKSVRQNFTDGKADHCSSRDLFDPGTNLCRRRFVREVIAGQTLSSAPLSNETLTIFACFIVQWTEHQIIGSLRFCRYLPSQKMRTYSFIENTDTPSTMCVFFNRMMGDIVHESARVIILFPAFVFMYTFSMRIF